MTNPQHAREDFQLEEVRTYLSSLNIEVDDEELIDIHAAIANYVLDELRWIADHGDMLARRPGLLRAAVALDIPQSALAAHGV